jgi:hypothetical protein
MQEPRFRVIEGSRQAQEIPSFRSPARSDPAVYLLQLFDGKESAEGICHLLDSIRRDRKSFVIGIDLPQNMRTRALMASIGNLTDSNIEMISSGYPQGSKSLGPMLMKFREFRREGTAKTMAIGINPMLSPKFWLSRKRSAINSSRVFNGDSLSQSLSYLIELDKECNRGDSMAISYVLERIRDIVSTTGQPLAVIANPLYVPKLEEELNGLGAITMRNSRVDRYQLQLLNLILESRKKIEGDPHSETAKISVAKLFLYLAMHSLRRDNPILLSGLMSNLEVPIEDVLNVTSFDKAEAMFRDLKQVLRMCLVHAEYESHKGN